MTGWVLHENRRTVLAMLAASSAGIVTTGVLRSLEARGVLQTVVATLLCGWAAFCLTHLLLCRAAYRGTAGAQLRERLLADPATASGRRRGPWARALLGGDGSSFAVTASSMSLIGVLALVLYPELRRDPLLLVLGVLLVVMAWLDMAMAYAVEYARTDLTDGGLVWPGRSDQGFADYEYFAFGVQSTLGTTDVSVGSTALRTTVRWHGTIAFAFNSVIIAVLVSLVLSLG